MPTFNQTLPFPASTVFTLAVKLDRPHTWYGSQTLAQSMAFSPDSATALPGGEAYVELLSNGGFVPTFNGFTKVGDRVWQQLPVGAKNLIRFFAIGTQHYYEFVEIPLPPPDTTAPTLVSVTTSGTSQITMVFSEVVTGSTTAADFNVQPGRSVVDAFVAGDQVNLIVSPAMVGGAAYTVSYYRPAIVANRLRDAAGNQVADIVDAAVTNTIADTTAPTATGAIGVGASVVVTFSEAINAANMPFAAAFNLVGTSPPAILTATRTAANQITLTTSANVPGAGISLTYTQPGAPTSRLQDASGNQTPSFTIPVN